jgi:hypothetical protein
MPQTLEIDVDQLMEQMRAGREKGFSAPPRFQTTGADYGCQEPPDLPFLRSGYDIYHIEFTSHRTVLGRVVVLLKRILRQLMTPILERQCALNLAGARVASHLQEQASQIQQQVFHLQQQVEELREQQTAVLQALRQNIDALGRDQAVALEVLRTDLVDQMQTFRQQVGRGLPEADV